MRQSTHCGSIVLMSFATHETQLVRIVECKCSSRQIRAPKPTNPRTSRLRCLASLKAVWRPHPCLPALRPSFAVSPPQVSNPRQITAKWPTHGVRRLHKTDLVDRARTWPSVFAATATMRRWRRSERGKIVSRSSRRVVLSGTYDRWLVLRDEILRGARHAVIVGPAIDHG